MLETLATMRRARGRRAPQRLPESQRLFSAAISPRHRALGSRHGLAYSCNTAGVAHGNGREESPLGQLKRWIEDRLQRLPGRQLCCERVRTGAAPRR